MKQLPVWICVAVFFTCSIWRYTQSDFKNVIHSDGRGYYAFLPAFFIYNDPSFEKSQDVETKSNDGRPDNLYLFENGDSVYDKYFPGVAIMQTPFFVLACAVSWLAGLPVDGYNGVFQFFIFFAGAFYVIVSLLVLQKILRSEFGEKADISRWIVVVFFTTASTYYLFWTPSLSHLYSFFLFVIAVYLWKRLIAGEKKLRLWFMFGAIIGMTFLVRPTNVIFILFLLTFFITLNDLLYWLKTALRKEIPFAVAGFFTTAIILLFIWKWESGSWILWSYSGERFDFLHTPWVKGMFSYRIGLFLHAPILLLVIIALVISKMWTSFQKTMYTLYFFVLSWTLLSWWCWDYETAFGNRAFSEHFFFLLFPLLLVFIEYGKRFWIISIPFIMLGMIRYGTSWTGRMTLQRFTRKNYFSSLMFWKPGDDQRWIYSLSCPPIANHVDTVLSFEQSDLKTIGEETEFFSAVESPLVFPVNCRYYFEVSCEKQMISGFPNDLFLIVDGLADEEKFRSYNSMPLYTDKLTKVGDWEKVTIQGQLYDYRNKLKLVKIYGYNPGRNRLNIRNFSIRLLRYYD